MIDLRSALPDHVEAALAEHEVRAARVALLSPLGERKGSRLSWRVDCKDGQTLKLRDFASEAEARRNREIRASLDPGFAPVLAQYGAVLIEAWIDGVPFNDDPSRARFREAGVLLAGLHAQPLGAGILGRAPTRGWMQRGESDMAILSEGGQLDADDVETLRARLRRSDPGSGVNAIIHTDFCAKNILVDAGGALWAIDNEHMAVGPAAFDLGCTFHRWTMSATGRNHFLAGYRSVAPEPEDLDFWQMLAALWASRVILEYDPAKIESSIQKLRQICSDAGGES